MTQTQDSVAPEHRVVRQLSRLDRFLRLAIFQLARAIPAGPSLPIAFNLQAYGRRA